MARRIPARGTLTERDSDQKAPNKEDHGRDNRNRAVLAEEIQDSSDKGRRYRNVFSG